MASAIPQDDRNRTSPIREDMAFQRRMWLFERAAWAAMFLLLAGAVLGLFSRGPVSGVTVQDVSGQFTVEYQRFERSDAATDFTIRLRPSSQADTVALTYSPSFLHGFTITAAHPAPLESRAGPDGLTQIFRSGGAPFNVHLLARPRRAGVIRSRITVEGGPSLGIMQFIYP